MSVGHQKRNEEDEEESDLPAPPDGGWGWMVVFGSFMIHIITDGVTYSFGIFYNEFLSYFEEGKAKTAWILSILVGVTLCSGPISSSLVNRWGCRAVTIMGAILASICMILSVFARNVTTLYFTIGIGVGFGFGLVYLPAIVSVTTYFEKYRSLATGIAVCGSGLGTFIFAPIITKLLSEYGWRGAMLIIAAVVLECTIFGALFRALPNEEKSQKQIDALLKTVDGNTDLHISEESIQMTSNGNGEMHRPHSVDHVPVSPKMNNDRLNGKTQNGNQQISRMTLSQPMLAQVERPHNPRHFGSQNFRKLGPLDRLDIFYQGSLKNISSHKSGLDVNNKEEAPMLMKKRASILRRRSIQSGQKSELCGFIPCSDEAKDTLKEMLDISLFKDWIFILFILSNFLTSVGLNVPYVYLVPKAEKFGISEETGGWLLAVVGIANTVGRIILGYLSDKTWVNRLLVYNWCLVICGIATMFSAFCSTFYSLAVYCSIFGFTIGAYVGLTSVILVDLLGLEKLTNAFGLLLLFQGISSLIGPPIAGALYDMTDSYSPGFYMAGINICLSGVVLFLIPPIQRHREKNRKQDLAHA